MVVSGTQCTLGVDDGSQGSFTLGESECESEYFSLNLVAAHCEH